MQVAKVNGHKDRRIRHIKYLKFDIEVLDEISDDDDDGKSK